MCQLLSQESKHTESVKLPALDSLTSLNVDRGTVENVLRYGLVLLDFNSGGNCLQSIGFKFIQFHINITVKTGSVVA